MDQRAFFDALMNATKLEQVRAAHEAFLKGSNVDEVPFGGRANNRGAIEVASDAARSLIERVTNAHDAILELEHTKRNGKPECRSPREAASAWLNVPHKEGLSGLSAKERQDLAKSSVVRLEPGEGWQSRILTVQDAGIGIAPERLKDTILSLNESNKIQKHYLAGTYGQGGSSTLAFSKFVFIATRAFGSDRFSLTLVRYEDLPAETFKTGRYVYLEQNGSVLVVKARPGDIEHGTIVRHFGYDLTNYSASIGPKSLYGALQRVLFDPVAPVRFENRVAGWNRTIKGARNALNGAVDQDDDAASGPDLDYHMPMFNVGFGDHGHVRVEYWVLARPAPKEGKKPSKPSRNFVDDTRPIVLSNNGQNQGELPAKLIKKDADLPFLQTQGRLIVHVNCDHLSPGAKRQLFSSTREQSREGFIQSLIQAELVKLLKADDELIRLNDVAREQSLKDRDDDAEKQMQKQVAKLLRLVGPAPAEVTGDKSGSEPGRGKRGGGGPRKKPVAIIPVDPPTYLKIVSDPDEDVTFFGGQRRYVRIETDANSSYHDPDDAEKSKLNIVVGADLTVFGTSPLSRGRMRIGIQCGAEVAVGTKGGIRVELYRPGMSTLSDERAYEVVEPPKPVESSRKASIPQFSVVPVDGPDDEQWVYIADEADSDSNDVSRHASGSEFSGGVLYVYYSTKFPRYASERTRLEAQDPDLAASFKKRYELWVAVHALLMSDDENNSKIENSGDEAAVREIGRQERCRLASIAAMVAAQEVKTGVNTEDAEDAS